MQANRTLKSSFGNLLRSATLAAATVTAASGLAAAQETPPAAPAQATLDEDRCLPMMPVAALETIIADAKTQLTPLTQQLQALDSVGMPLGQQLRTVTEALESADDAAKPALETQRDQLQAQLAPLSQQRRDLMQQIRPLQQRQLLAEFQKGVTSFSGWKDIEARVANVDVTFDGVCAAPGDGPVSVTHNGDLTTLDVITSELKPVAFGGPDGRIVGTSVVVVPKSLDTLIQDMPNLVSQGVYYAGLNGVTPPGNEVLDPSYDPHTLSMLTIVSSTVAAADQILLAVERAVSGEDLKAVEIAYQEFPAFGDQISNFYLTASEKIGADGLPDDLRASFRQELVMFALQDPAMRQQMVGLAFQQLAGTMAQAFRQVGPNQMALADPRPIFHVADQMFSKQPDEAEITAKLARYGLNAATLVATYDQWKTRSDDPAKPILENIAQIKAQAEQMANGIRQHMLEQQQNQQAPQPAPVVPQAPVPAPQ